MGKNQLKTKTTVQCALFIAIALILRNFSYMVYMGGGAGMRIGVSGFFTKLPALLFGPMYGGITSAAVDFLGFVIKPDGGYIFPLTITAFCGGIITGYLYKLLKNKSPRSIRGIYISVTALTLVLGIINHIFYVFFPNSFLGKIIKSFAGKANFFIVGMYVAAGLGTLFYIINMLLAKRLKKSELTDMFFKLFAVFFVSDIIVTTANTFILTEFIPALKKLGFFMFYMPRLVQEILSVFISSYVVTYLMELAKKIKIV